MKRILLHGAAVAAVLILGVTSAFAAGGHKKKTKPTTVTTRVTCVAQLTLQAPSDDTTVSQGATDGTQWGTTKCKAPLGAGAMFESFKTDDGGDITGKWQQFFKDGTTFGTFAMTPDDTGPPTSTSFSASSSTGTITVKGGTGADRKATGAGTLHCATQDAVHFTCTAKLKLVGPAAAKR